MKDIPKIHPGFLLFEIRPEALFQKKTSIPSSMISEGNSQEISLGGNLYLPFPGRADAEPFILLSITSLENVSLISVFSLCKTSKARVQINTPYISCISRGEQWDHKLLSCSIKLLTWLRSDNDLSFKRETGVF